MWMLLLMRLFFVLSMYFSREAAQELSLAIYRQGSEYISVISVAATRRREFLQ